MYDHTLHRGKKHFCRYNLQVFRTEEILKRHIKYCFKINDNGEYVKLKNYERDLKSSFYNIYIFWKYFGARRQWKAKSRRVLHKEYQKHIVCSYDYKLFCVDDKFSKPF